MNIIEKNIKDLVPYENNPRKNEEAVTITNKFSGKFQQIDWQHEFLQSVK